MTAEQYLESIMPTRDEVDAFLEPDIDPQRLSRHGGVSYDPELGWIRVAAVRQDGVDDSKTFYSYEPDHARKVINGAGQPGRMHTFGDSFTHCDQVNDGETWQEYLAAHLREPVRNYGVGGYSVYQAYLRMKRVNAARFMPYVLLNIYDHDHYRNLFNWWAINYGRRVECGFTCPHLRVNVAADRIEERPHLLNRPADVYKLCDRDWVIETFRDDPLLPIALARRHPEFATQQTVERVAAGFGIPLDRVAGQTPGEAIEALAAEAALCATRHVVKLVESFVQRTNKKLMILLSNCAPYTADFLAGRPRWDQPFVDFLRGRGYPVLDMREAFAAEYATCRAEPTEYLRRYYNGHHSPAGNYFTAWAIKDAVAQWLEPKPSPYAPHDAAALVEDDGWKKANQAWHPAAEL